MMSVIVIDNPSDIVFGIVNHIVFDIVFDRVNNRKNILYNTASTSRAQYIVARPRRLEKIRSISAI